MTKNIFNFTHDTILKIKIPTEKRVIYKDTKELGLLLIASYGGSKTFYLGREIQGKYKRIKIGDFPYLSVADARIKAIELKNQIASGQNPLEKKENLTNEKSANFSDKTTFEYVFNRYINDYARHNIKGWKNDIADMEKNAKDLYSKEVSEITRQDIQKIFNNITTRGTYAANRFIDRVKAVLNKAIETMYLLGIHQYIVPLLILQGQVVLALTARHNFLMRYYIVAAYSKNQDHRP
ncbi:MAG TPA: Arm DNA-binding domain-containing protein [Rickettsia endosymbiont of Pyrocoelia pectoralis]|nr:Arm DNA-binding domain-containing protein [Rickettsia endosymbiont of Pyrocoelia pectoralis]